MKFQSLYLKLKKLIGSHGYGRFQSFLRGSGMNWQGVRRYESTDDLRAVNRKVSAKHDQLFTNTFIQEKDSVIHVFLDTNINWSAGRGVTPWQKIQEICGDLIITAHRQGMKLKFFWNEKHSVVSSDLLSSVSQSYGILKSVEKIVGTFFSEYSTGIAEFLHQQKNYTKHHGIIIFSDFLGCEKEDYRLLKIYQSKHHVLCFRIGIDSFKGRNYEDWMIEKPIQTMKEMIDIV